MLDIHMVHFCIYIYIYMAYLGPHSRTSYQCWTTGACHSVNLSLECLRIACLQLKHTAGIYIHTWHMLRVYIHIYTCNTDRERYSIDTNDNIYVYIGLTGFVFVYYQPLIFRSIAHTECLEFSVLLTLFTP